MTAPATPAAAHALSRRGLIALFGSTLFALCGVFMLSPLLLLLLTQAQVSTSVAGLFAATTWLGILLITPLASGLVARLGRRPAMWLATGLPLLSVLGFYATRSVPVWFGLELLSGMAGGLRWVLAEALVAEFAPPAQRGRYIGLYSTTVGMTFVIGPALLAWVGVNSPYALLLVLGLLGVGLLWTALIPALPATQEAHSTAPRTGLRGLWQALRAHPVVMLAGFVGGFFELGLASILPLLGLALGWGAAAATLLVAVSGLGGTLFALPAGLLADAMATRMGSPAQARLRMMSALSTALLGSSAAMLGVAWCGAGTAMPQWLQWLLWPIVAVWGAAGGALYTLTMTDIGARAHGVALVNSTAVLVLTYTLGGLAASAISGVLIERSPAWAFAPLLIAVSAMGLGVLRRAQASTMAQ